MVATLNIINQNGFAARHVLTEGHMAMVDCAGGVIVVPVSSVETLHARLSAVEAEVNRLRDAEPAGAPHLRDMGATLVDKARARLLDAQAAKLEAETREYCGAPPDDGHSPVSVESWKSSARSDLGTIHPTLSDREGREYQLTLLPNQARELAEALLSGARLAATGRER